MSGAGFKTFGVGDVLTASDVNGYLMSQAVLNFADSGARGSAIGTATEGMLSYLADTDAVEVYDGSAWVGLGGGVVQFKYATDGTARTTTSASFTSASLSVSITPTDASSLLVVTWTASIQANRNAGNFTSRRSYFRIIENGGSAVPGAEEQEVGITVPAGTNSENWTLDNSLIVQGVVTAGSTSARTYDAEFRVNTTNMTVDLQNADRTGVLSVAEISPGVL